MKNVYKFLLIVAGIVIIAGALIYVANRSRNKADTPVETVQNSDTKTDTTATTEPTDPSYIAKLAKFMTEKGMILYGAYWCPHCQDQKKLFGDAFQYVDYVECDAQGPNPNPDECTARGIEGYPTWIYQGTKYSGLQSLSTLAKTVGFSE